MRTATIENFLPLFDRTNKIVDVGHTNAHHGWLRARLAHIAPRQWRMTLGILLLGVTAAIGWLVWQDRAVARIVPAPSIQTTSRLQPSATKLSQVQASPHNFADLQSAALAAIAERQQAVTTLSNDVATSTAIDSETRSKLTTELATATTGLTELTKQIQSATADDATFQQQVADIAGKFPVFSLILPQIQGIEVVVINQHVVALGTQTAVQLADFIKAADAQHKSTDALKAAVTTYQSKLRAINDSLNQANQSFVAIDGTASSDNTNHRDTGIAALTNASQTITEASDYLNQTIAPLVKQLKS